MRSLVALHMQLYLQQRLQKGPQPQLPLYRHHFHDVEGLLSRSHLQLEHFGAWVNTLSMKAEFSSSQSLALLHMDPATAFSLACGPTHGARMQIGNWCKGVVTKRLYRTP